MTKIDEVTKKAVGIVEGKGDSIAVSGTTECGKSTAMAALAAHEDVQDILAVREASGKGSTCEVSIVATDMKDIPENKLIMTAKMKEKTIADCNDDNELIGNVVYSGAKDYSKNPNDVLYYSKMSKALKNALLHPANESLAYKIKGMTDNDFEVIFNIFKKFPIDEIMVIFNEMQARNSKKGQHGVRIFIELLSERPSFETIIKEFWDYIVMIINRDIYELKDKLISGGADVEELPDNECKFIAIIGKEDIESSLVEVLLKSEDGSKEYLLSDVQLIFRGAEYLFDVENVNQLIVAETAAMEIHCIRFIDTQGLFHATGVKPKDEAERIEDILAEHHCDKLLLVVNSFITDTVKDGYEATRFMLQEANRDLKIYILYTHWDEYLKKYSQQNGSNKFERAAKRVDWAQRYEDATVDQNKVTQMFMESIAENTNKRKPCILGTYKAAILSDPDSKMEDLLYDKDVMYPKALHSLLNDILCEEAKNGNKHKVIEEIRHCFSIDSTAYGKQSIKDLYENLVVECKKPLKLYASTVRACNRKWCSAGNPHKSDVAVNDYGFQNIETRFVREIRNYAMNCLSKVSFDVSDALVPGQDKEKFLSDLKLYLTLNQNVGREVAKMIGDEAYKYGFNKEAGFRYQYSRFMDMLQYTQDTYFQASSIVFTNAFENCLEAAITKCINEFVDSKCIVVY